MFKIPVYKNSLVKLAHWCHHDDKHVNLKQERMFYLYGYPWYLDLNTERSRLKKMATNPSPTMDNTEKNGKYRLLLNEDLNCNTVNFGIKEHS